MRLPRIMFDLFNDSHANVRQQSMRLLLIVLIFTVCIWLLTYYLLHHQPILLSTALLAYTFGLRHGLDADHIAAIDNVTRKLMQEGKQPISLGFFFSLGHATVVFVVTIGVAIGTSRLMQSSGMPWVQIVKQISTSISASFLLFIAFYNVLLLLSIRKAMRTLQGDKMLSAKDTDFAGMLPRFWGGYFQKVFALVHKSRHMYGVGFVFGLSFDTATEIALLGIAASQTVQGLSPWTILIYPALFTIGMTLIDTVDTFLMLSAYGLAYRTPQHTLFYNGIITGVSVFVALCIGSLQWLGLLKERFQWTGAIWDMVYSLNNHLDYLGCSIVLFFVIAFILTMTLFITSH